jgi:hypothetical protein
MRGLSHWRCYFSDRSLSQMAVSEAAERSLAESAGSDSSFGVYNPHVARQKDDIGH